MRHDRCVFAPAARTIKITQAPDDVSVAIDLGHEISVGARYSANIARVDNDRRYKPTKCAASTGTVNATEMQRAFYRKCGECHAKSTPVTLSLLYVKKIRFKRIVALYS